MNTRNRAGALGSQRGAVAFIICTLTISVQMIPAAGASLRTASTTNRRTDVSVSVDTTRPAGTAGAGSTAASRAAASRTAAGRPTTVPGIVPADPLRTAESRAKAAGTGPQAAEAWAAYATTALRESARRVEPSLLTVAESALAQAERLDGRRVEVRLARAETALVKHDFSSAAVLARALVDAEVGGETARLVLTDSLIELGRLDEAAAEISPLADRRPSPPVLARVSYLRELTGDLPGALAAMTAAEEQARFDPATQPTFSTLLGDLHLVRGDVRSADAAYLRALSNNPMNPLAQYGRARVAAAIGRDRDALTMLEHLIDRVPLPSASALAAELAERLGLKAEAANYDALVRATISLFAQSGTAVDLELSLLEANRGDAALAVRLARDASRTVKTSAASDTVAWSLLRSGKPAEAVAHSTAALASGTADPVIRAHTALVYEAAGDVIQARTQLRMLSGKTAALSPTLRAAVIAAATRLSVSLAAVPNYPTFRS